MLTALRPQPAAPTSGGDPTIFVAVDDVFRLTDPLMRAVFGLTKKAVERKIERADWVEGRQYHRAPDGTIWINRAGVRRWVISGKA